MRNIDLLPYALKLPIPINCSEDRPSYLQLTKLDSVKWKCAYVYHEYNDSSYPREYIQMATSGNSIDDAVDLMIERLREAGFIK